MRDNYFYIAIFFVFSLSLSACLLKTTDSIQVETPVDKAKKNEQTRQMPLGEHAFGQPQFPSQDLPLDPDIKTGKLRNGLTYYIRHNEKPNNRAELRLVIKAGSVLENEDQLGLAHFIEHMAFNGSAHFEKNELIEYLESVGSRFGPDLNAYTSFDETVYMLQVRTDDTLQFNKGLLVLQDWGGGLSFDHEEIDKERGVVISEWRSRLSPGQRMMNRYFPVKYKGSMYAKRMPIGDPDIIKHADYELIKRFYRDWYRPDLMAVVVVGDIDPESVEKQIKEGFGMLENPELEKERKKFKVPNHAETLISIQTDREESFTNVQLYYKHPHLAVSDQKGFKKKLVRSLYNGVLNARLSELTNIADPPFTFAYTAYRADLGNIDMYASNAMTGEGKAIEAFEVLLTENERVKRFGFTITELERQKINMLKRSKTAVKEQDKSDSRRWASKCVNHFLNDSPLLSPTQYDHLLNAYLPQISLEEVNELAHQWISDENRVVVITGPEKEGLEYPTEAELKAIFKKVENKQLDPYVDNVSDKALFSEKLGKSKVVKSATYKNMGIDYLELENGIKVYLKETDFKNDEILFSAYSEGGSSLYSDKDFLSGEFASGLIDNSGLGEFGLVQLEKKLTGKKVSVSPYISGMYEGLVGSASPEDVETMFQLIHMYFTQPRVDEDAFESMIVKRKSIYSNLLENPYYWFYNESTKIKYNNHPRMGFPTKLAIGELQMHSMEKIYKERFADAGDFTFVFVGNFNKTALTELLLKYLGNLPSLPSEEKWIDRKQDMINGIIDTTLIKGEAPKSYVDLTWHGPFVWNQSNKYQLTALKDILKIKLRESLREDKGGVYGVNVSAFPSQYPTPRYQINISFNCDPEKAKELIEASIAEINALKNSKVEAKYMKTIKETQKQSRIKALEENRYWLNRIVDVIRQHGSFDSILLPHLQEQIDKLTGEDIKKTANLYFSDDNMLKIVMVPEK